MAKLCEARIESSDPAPKPVNRMSEISELSPRILPTARRIDYLAEQLAELGTANSLQQVLRLGEIVHSKLCSAVRAKEADRRASLRRIAAHPLVPFKVTTIWRAVSVYEMSLRLPHLFDSPHLGISHLRAVIGLGLADQELLLTLASSERWTKRQLEREAAKKRDSSKRRGRPPLPKLTMWTRDLDRLLERAEEFAEGDLGLLATESREALAVLDRFQKRTEEIRKQLELAPALRDKPPSRDVLERTSASGAASDPSNENLGNCAAKVIPVPSENFIAGI